MSNLAPTPSKEIFLKDYLAPQYLIKSCYLDFEIHESYTLVTNTMQIVRNKAVSHSDKLELNGEELELIDVFYNDSQLKDYVYDNDLLKLTPSDESFELKVVNKINPAKNLKLMGLFESGSILCTQCEAEGFRRITFFVDRPDNLTIFKTRISADEKYKYLLSNGNLVSRQVRDGKLICEWEDPFPKPSYLFALVAGDLDLVRDEFITKSGKKVALEIYVDKGKLDQTPHAMNCLKQSMKWDEDRFNLEYDLDIYMIVAVDSFNMGAMENKGLNVFNSKYILGNAVTATDKDLYDIQAVIGHEYFHNWTGNRVTCRDWFQLTLKEGLTVFRDREFSSDLNSRAVKRIDDVNFLRSRQFTEDAGPFSHPIKPKSFVEINNFYTMTIYEKGAEVIGMIETIIGKENFTKGIEKYFELYDGSAAITENFINAMEIASGISLKGFSRWYDVSGTPRVKVQLNEGEIVLTQNLAKDSEAILEIPLRFKFLNECEYELEATHSEIIKRKGEDPILLMKDKSLKLKTKSSPLLSLNRGFSAPIILERNWEEESLSELISFEDDPFSLWDYGQMLFDKVIKQTMRDETSDIEVLQNVCHKILNDQKLDDHFKSYFLSIPSETILNESLDVYDFSGVKQARSHVKKALALSMKDELLVLYKDLKKRNVNHWNNEMMGVRALQNTALSLLASIGEKELVVSQYKLSENMTNKMFALEVLNEQFPELASSENEDFHKVCDKYDQLLPLWFQAQVFTPTNTLSTLKKLEGHEDFKSKVPNYLYRLYGGALGKHLDQCYRKDSELFKYLIEKCADIDSYNPQVASRFFQSLKSPDRLQPQAREYTKNLLQNIYNKGLSKDSSEVVGKFIGK